MELKKIITIFQKHAKSFWLTVVVCVMLGFIWQYNQTDAVAVNMTLNITRLGADKTTDYQYHDFYRLQADERFADTVVRWLASPRIVSDIYTNIRLNDNELDSSHISHAFKAERLSSQMIQVTYKAKNEVIAQKIARSVTDRINIETSTLNKDQQEASWFVVVGDAPVVQDARLSLSLVLTLALVSGIFLGFWSVLLRHYFFDDKKD
jgi:capsular polysaccharide biosynthesis protein